MLSATKTIGTLGELAVAQDLIRRGWDVYTAIGDCTKIDIVAIKEHVIKRHQIKSVQFSLDGVVCVEAAKTISGKRVPYHPDDFDYLTLYVVDRNRIAYIPLSVIYGRSLTLRFTPTKNGQVKNVQSFDNFTELAQ